MRLLMGATAVAGAAYLLLAAALFFFQEQLIYFPEIGRDDPGTPARHGLAYDDVSIATADGETLHAWYVAAPDARGTALFFHGNAGSIAQRIDWLPAFRHLRLNTLLVEYRGYGRSSGTPSEQGMYRDAAAALAHLTGARGAAAQDVVVFGESLGGAVALWLAEKSRPGALVVMSAFTSVPDLAAELYPFLPARRLARFDYDALGRIRRVTCPVLVAHSPQDEIVPYAHGRRLFEAAPEPKQFLDLGGGHNDGFIFTRREWVDQLGAFLDRHWRAAP